MRQPRHHSAIPEHDFRHLRRLWCLAASLALVAGLVTTGPAFTASGRPLPSATSAGLRALAEQLINRRTSALVRGVAPSSASRLANPLARASAATAATENKAIAELTARRDALRQVREEYARGESSVTVKNLRITGDTATLDVVERGKLFYAKINGDEPDYTAWKADRQFVFTRVEGLWSLDRQGLTGPQGIPPINEPTGASVEAMQRVVREINASRMGTNSVRTQKGGGGPSRGTTADTSSQFTTAAYNYSAMAAYAERYWDNYNPAYRTFADTGGDCTNFISQAMRAGGWTDVTGWYLDDNNWWYNFSNQTRTWINVQYWYAFAALRSHRTYILARPEDMLLADVLQADFQNDGHKDHTMIVTWIAYGGRYLTYHTTDTYRRSLASIKASFPSARWLPHRT